MPAFVQVPVNYQPRVGTSSVTGELPKTIKLGSEMLALGATMRARRRKIRANVR